MKKKKKETSGKYKTAVGHHSYFEISAPHIGPRLLNQRTPE